MTVEPSDLVHVAPDTPSFDGIVLLQALDGFVDAGGARRLAREHLLRRGSQVVATFDADLLFDYRARRPAMLFAGDRWESYDDPLLAVHLLDDAAGAPYLLLAGPEPDVMWERWVRATVGLVRRFGVRLTVGLDAIPMAVPHTRPAGVIAHGTRSELVAGHEPWVQRVSVPGSAGHLLEHRLGQAGLDAVGFAVNVPHYLAQLDYPLAAEELLRAAAAASRLSFDTAALAEAAGSTREQVDAQVAQSDEVRAVVAALEQQYDAFVAGRERSLLAGEGRLPSGDELGAELERFLAERSRGEPGQP